MALFGKKKTEEVKPKAEKAVVSTSAKKAPKVAKTMKATGNAASMPHAVHVILRPRITEKATVKADAENVYVFEIAHDANKTTVSQAIRTMYNVVPVKVAIVRTPGKKHMSRGKQGFTSGLKKAYVYIKKGEKIELV